MGTKCGAPITQHLLQRLDHWKVVTQLACFLTCTLGTQEQSCHRAVVRGR